MIQLLNAGAAAAASAAVNQRDTAGYRASQWIVDFMQGLSDNWQTILVGAFIIWIAGALVRVGLFGERKK